MSGTALETLYQDLLGQVPQGLIVISPTTESDGWTAIGQLLTDYFGGQITLDAATPSMPTSELVQVTGTGDPSCEPFAGLSMSLAFTYDTDAEVYVLNGTATLSPSATAPWTLADGWPSLAVSSNSFFLAPLAAAAIAGPTFTLDSTTGSFTFGGAVQLGALLAMPPFFPGQTSVAVSGAVTAVGAAGPAFVFTSGAGEAISLGGLFTVTPSLVLATVVDLGPPPTATASLTVGATVGAGADQALQVSTSYPFAGPLVFSGDADATLGFAVDLLATLTGTSFDALLPTTLPLGTASFQLQGWSLQLAAGSLELLQMTLTAGLAESWPIASGIELDGLTFVFSNQPGQQPQLTVTVVATLMLQEATITLLASAPSFAFLGQLTAGTIDLHDLVAIFSPDAAEEISPGLVVTALQLQVAPSSSAYSFSATVSTPWTLSVLGQSFALDGVTLAFADNGGQVAASVAASLTLGSADQPLTVSGSYDSGSDGSPAAWSFSASDATLDWQDLVDDVFGSYFPDLETALDSLDGITLDQLTVTFGSAGYAFAADVAWAIDVPLPGNESLSLNVAATVNLQAPASAGPSSIAGTVSIAGSAPLGVSVTLGDGKVSTVMLAWPAQPGISASYSLGDSTVTFTATDQTVGSVVTAMLDALPLLGGAALTPPWDLLNGLALPDDTTVSLDFATSTATLSASGLGANLGFIDVEAVQIAVDWGASTVEFAITDYTILGQPNSEPLSWNLQPPAQPPAPQGQGGATFQLQLLALSQRYAVSGLDSSSVTAAATSLKTAFGGPAPGVEGSLLTYSPATNWVIGLQATVLGVQIGGVFVDPGLYGLAVSVGSPNGVLAKLAGLDFEVLYKSLGPNLGVYQGNLTLPDVVRNQQLGALSITLPSMQVSVYTNGNFEIDLGFPYNGDFSQSFTLQWLPFTGSGGFYFGVLDGSTATNLPATTLGTFSPVVVFGIGVNVGLGKTVTYGPLSASLSLTVQGIVEGTFAPFHPTSGTPNADAFYYAVTGQVAVVGQLYGQVSFAIVSARFDVTATVSLTVVMVAYQPVLLSFTATVSVSASLEINLGLFKISLSFSFDLTVTEQLTIGTASPAPWEGADVAAAKLRRFRRRLPAPELPTLQWVPVVAPAPVAVPLLLVPHLTAASAVSFEGQGPTLAQLVAMTYIECTPAGTVPPDSTSPFSTLAQGVLAWAVAANSGATGPVELATLLSQPIDAEQLQNLYDALPGNPFTFDDLEQFFGDYYAFAISQPDPTGGAADVSVFPILPPMSMQPQDYSFSITFGECNIIGPAIVAAIQARLQAMQPKVPWASTTPPTPPPDWEALATLLFVDYFSFLCRAVVQAAVDAALPPPSGPIVPPPLTTLGDLIAQMQDAAAFDAFAPQAARAFLQGLRLPWGTEGTQTITRALYELNGQQVDVSQAQAGYSIEFSLPAAITWASFTGSSSTSATMTLDADTIAIIGELNGASIAPSFSSAAQPYTNTVPVQFTLAAPVVWTLTDGSQPPSSIWQFPASLVQLLASDPTLAPTVTIGVVSPDGQPDTPPADYAWATAFAVEVALIPEGSDPSATIASIYNVVGTDPVASAYLQALIEAGSAGTVTIDQVYFLFPLQPGVELPSAGVQSDPVEATSFFVVASNLSTRTPAQMPSHADILFNYTRVIE